MKKAVSALLCAATLLTLSACKKEAPSTNSAAPIDLQAYIAEAAGKTAAQPSFRMTGTCTGSSSVHYNLQVNGYGTEDIQACGSMEKDGDTETFSVDGTSYRYQRISANGSVSSETVELREEITCQTLTVCDFILSLPHNQSVQEAMGKNGNSTHSDGVTTVTAPLSNTQFLSSDDTATDASLSISVSDSGYVAGVILSYRLDGLTQKYDFSFTNQGITQEIVPVKITAVSSDTWQNAFSPAMFENVTVTRYYDDRTKENPSIQMISGSVSARSFQRSQASTGGISSTTVGMIYFYQHAGQYYKLEDGTATNQDGSQTRHYLLTATELYAGETPSSFASSLDTSYGFSGHYGDYTYDAQTGTYTGTASDEEWNYRYVVAFSDGRLESIQITLEDLQTKEIKTVHSYYFTDYGTTNILIPTE